MFTWVLVALAALVLVALVVHEIRSWRKPGRQIGLNAPMDDRNVNEARFTSGTNYHNDQNGLGGPGGI